ncbi:hypothetical protein [Methylotuvimicrobium sp. KM1]|uniref:hypothetical protein n=1 Tax=Methylotuvimicrobium sp. KM1 TaxID=3377707 RepID=UPI00384EBF55
MAHGGHNIPEQAIERRFARIFRNLLTQFSYAVDRCACFMNTCDETTLIFEQQGEQRNVIHAPFYQHLLNKADL